MSGRDRICGQQQISGQLPVDEQLPIGEQASPWGEPPVTLPDGAVSMPAAVVVGQLIALADDGGTPLVLFPGQHGAAAVRARSVVDLHASHIGEPVTLLFEGGAAARPIVMGVIQRGEGWLGGEAPVEVESDGERLVVSARQQLVLRCGKASITLTKAGKVLIQGSYVSSRATGVNRIKGGSVQLN